MDLADSEKNNMLKGIDTLLSQPTASLQTNLQQLFIEYASELEGCFCVDGSFKKIYALPGGKYALACFREKGNEKALQNGKMLLTKEKELLHYLQSVGLPAVNVYCEPFLFNEQYALLMEWIPDSTFIDVKDQDSASRKIISSLLNVHIPSGEGWVLKKASIDQEISEALLSPSFSVDLVKARAYKLGNQFSQIKEILTANNLMIGDLQFLLNPKGVFIIDPIEVVKVSPKPNSSNMFDYCDVLDLAKQDNPNFIKLLYDGKRLLEQCIALCDSLAELSSKKALQEKLQSLMTTKEVKSPRQGSLAKELLTKNFRTTATFSPHSEERKRSTAITIPPRRVMSELNVRTLELVSTTPLEIAKTSPHSSPEKKALLAVKENDPESPTKLLAFQFGSTGLSKPQIARCLFLEEEDVGQSYDFSISPPGK